MPFFRSFASESEIGDVYRFEPRIWRGFLEFSRELMRGPSPLSPGERELIAGYVSGLNACEFCHGSHTAAAVAFGFPEHLMPQLLKDGRQCRGGREAEADIALRSEAHADSLEDRAGRRRPGFRSRMGRSRAAPRDRRRGSIQHGQSADPWTWDRGKSGYIHGAGTPHRRQDTVGLAKSGKRLARNP